MTKANLGAALTLTAAVLLGACLDSGSKVHIEWGMYPEEFEGLEVLVDGESVGTLQKFGQATRTAFTLSKGEHTLCVKHPSLECVPTKVSSESGPHTKMLLLDIQEFASADGSIKPMVAFQN